METNEYLHIVYASDDRGRLPLTVAAYSLLEHAAAGTHYELCILSDGISAESLDYLRAHLAPVMAGHRLRVIDVAEKLPQDLVLGEQWVLRGGKQVRVSGGRQWPRVAWSRIFLADLLPEVHRALYLDIDTLVCTDVSPLFRLPMEGCSVGVVTEHESHPGSHFNERLDIPQSCLGYFNSGVLLMNLDYFRAHDAVNKILNFARSHADALTSPDQDALNGALCDSLLRLHPRWNWHDGLTRLMLKADPGARLWRGNPPKQSLEAALWPGILHYQGRHKPWLYNHRPERGRYEQTMLHAGVISRLPLPGRNFGDALKRVFYAPLYALMWRRIWRMAAQLGAENPEKS